MGLEVLGAFSVGVLSFVLCMSHEALGLRVEGLRLGAPEQKVRKPSSLTAVPKAPPRFPNPTYFVGPASTLGGGENYMSKEEKKGT